MSARLILGDCRDVLATLDAESVDVAITDPPYEITAAGGGIGARRDYLHKIKGFTDSGFDYGILSQFRSWVCFGTLRQLPTLIGCAGERRWMLVTWNKPDPTPLTNGNYLPDTEYIVHAWDRGCLYGTYADKARFIVHPSGRREHGHPNEKPLAVMLKMVLLASKPGDLIIDPYMGSGSTGVAALRAGRRFIGIEADPKWYAIAKQRIDAEERQGSLFS